MDNPSEMCDIVNYLNFKSKQCQKLNPNLTFAYLHQNWSNKM